MAEPKDEQLMAAVRSTLAAIVGDGGTTYWYTPDNVVRSQALRGSHLDGMPKGSTVAYVIVSDRKSCEDQDSCRHLCTIGFDVWGLYRLPTAADNNEYAKRTPLVPTIQARMARDVETALIRNPPPAAFVGLVEGSVFVDNDDRSPESTDFEGFAVSVQGFRTQYSHVWGTP